MSRSQGEVGLGKHSNEPYFAYMMVTADPDVAVAGSNPDKTRKGSAYELTMARLEKDVWVLYRRTQLKRQVERGSRLLFYVGGNKDYHSRVIASGIVDRVEDWSYTKGDIDPIQYLTNLPSKVLHLQDVRFARNPKSVKELLPKLSFAPKNLRFWGAVLQGGCTGLSKADWRLLAP